MPTWETFTPSTIAWGLLEEPAVTIQKRGVLSINASAYQELGRPTAVELLFDREERIIGIRPSLAATGGLQVWFPSGKTAPAQVSAGRFFKYFGIGIESTLRHPAVMDDGVLCVDLDEPGTPVGRGGHRGTDR